MKIIVLLYLEEDQKCVTRFLKENGVMAYSQLPVEGHGSGVAGWYGAAAPYASRMAFTIVPEAQAQAILQAVEGCNGVADARHPIHAIQMGVEAAVDSGGGAVA